MENDYSIKLAIYNIVTRNFESFIRFGDVFIDRPNFPRFDCFFLNMVNNELVIWTSNHTVVKIDIIKMIMTRNTSFNYNFELILDTKTVNNHEYLILSKDNTIKLLDLNFPK